MGRRNSLTFPTLDLRHSDCVAGVPILVKSGRKHQKTMRARASCLAQGLEQSLVGEALGQVLGTDHRGAQETNSR